MMVIDLSLSLEEWHDLKRFFQRLGGVNGLDYRGSIDDSGGAVSVLSLSLCTEPDSTIGVNEQCWHHRGGGRLISVEETPVGDRFAVPWSGAWPHAGSNDDDP